MSTISVRNACSLEILFFLNFHLHDVEHNFGFYPFAKSLKPLSFFVIDIFIGKFCSDLFEVSIGPNFHL